MATKKLGLGDVLTFHPNSGDVYCVSCGKHTRHPSRIGIMGVRYEWGSNRLINPNNLPDDCDYNEAEVCETCESKFTQSVLTEIA